MSEDENTRYHMPVENRGFALIFVNDSFKDSTEQSPRRGAEIDSQRLIQTFTKLHFSILAVKNQTTTETLAIIRKCKSEFTLIGLLGLQPELKFRRHDILRILRDTFK